MARFTQLTLTLCSVWASPVGTIAGTGEATRGTRNERPSENVYLAAIGAQVDNAANGRSSGCAIIESIANHS